MHGEKPADVVLVRYGIRFPLIAVRLTLFSDCSWPHSARIPQEMVETSTGDATGGNDITWSNWYFEVCCILRRDLIRMRC
jgi:hypothetical protein